MMILSTNGSKMRPNLVTLLYLRAHQPSIQSVEAATMNTIIAAKYCSSGINTNTTSDSKKRMAVRTLGTLRIVFDDGLDTRYGASGANCHGQNSDESIFFADVKSGG